MGYLEDLACILRFNKTLIACSVAKMFRQYKPICNKCVNKSRSEPQLGQYVSPHYTVHGPSVICTSSMLIELPISAPRTASNTNYNIMYTSNLFKRITQKVNNYQVLVKIVNNYGLVEN